MLPWQLIPLPVMSLVHFVFWIVHSLERATLVFTPLLCIVPHLEVFKAEVTFQTPGSLSPAPSPALPLLYLLNFLLFWSTLQEHTVLTRVLVDQAAPFQKCMAEIFILARFSEIIALDVYDSTESTALVHWSIGLKQRMLLHYWYVRNALHYEVFQTYTWKILNFIPSHLCYKNVWQFSLSVAWLKEKPRP